MAALWSILPSRPLGAGPGFPAVGFVEQPGVFLAFQLGFHRLAVFQCIEVFEEQQPGRLLGVVELAGAACFFAQDVVDVFEGLFKHEILSPVKPDEC